MNEIITSFYVGKSYGKDIGFHTLYFIHITDNSVITDCSDIQKRRVVEKHTYKHFKERFGYDVDLIIRQTKIKKILNNLR